MDKLDLSRLSIGLKVALKKSLVQAANEASNHFIESFKNQGFTDERLKKWKPRKNKKDTGRAILVKKGDLRRSIKVLKVDHSTLRASIGSTGLIYAAVHNFGLMAGRKSHPFIMPKRQFIGSSKKLNNAIKKIIDRNIKGIIK